jgi:hypothetical protein
MRNIYTTGFKEEDFVAVKDGIALVQAITPSALSSLISIQSQVLGNQVYCFKVIHGKSDTLGDLANKTVILRNSMLESIDVQLSLFLIDTEHILAIVDPE